MTPEQRLEMETLKKQVALLMAESNHRKIQQILFPLDPASRAIFSDLATVIATDVAQDFVVEDAIYRTGSKVTAAPPYTNDGYLPVSDGTTTFKLMTTA